MFVPGVGTIEARVCWLVLVMATSNQAHSTLLRVWPISPQHAPGVCTSSNPPHVHPSMACQQSSSTTALLDQGDVHAPRSRGDHLGFQLVFLMLALLLLLPALLVYTGTGTEHRGQPCTEKSWVMVTSNTKRVVVLLRGCSAHRRRSSRSRRSCRSSLPLSRACARWSGQVAHSVSEAAQPLSSVPGSVGRPGVCKAGLAYFRFRSSEAPAAELMATTGSLPARPEWPV